MLSPRSCCLLIRERYLSKDLCQWYSLGDELFISLNTHTHTYLQSMYVTFSKPFSCTLSNFVKHPPTASKGTSICPTKLGFQQTWRCTNHIFWDMNTDRKSTKKYCRNSSIHFQHWRYINAKTKTTEL